MLNITRFRLALNHTLPRWLLLSALLFACGAVGAEEDVVKPEVAFQYTVEADGENITVDWIIQPAYYMYKSRMAFISNNPNVTLGTPTLPKGKLKTDEFFGEQEIYRNKARVTIPYEGEAGDFELQLRSQGCADAGLCYPPQRWNASVALPVRKIVANNSNTGGESLLDMLAQDAQFGGEDNYLPVTEAFRFSALMIDDYTLMVRWDIEDGYYLYRDKLTFEGQSDIIQLGAVEWPAGEDKVDEHFGAVKVFYFSAETEISVSRASPNSGELTLTANYQGCADEGICYAPEQQIVTVAVDQAGQNFAAVTVAAGGTGINGSGSGTLVSEQDKLATLIKDGSLPLVMATFFGLGLLLAFTPCVLPMVPILSGIIGGQKGEITTRRSFILSLVYVLAMALTYTVIGIIVAMLGQNVQALFQNPAVLIGFSLVFVALALAMFDVWQFQVPVALQNKLNQAGSGGGYFGVGIMGALSALIVGPCVAAPLVAVLIFIGQSGDAVRGGLTLFALSMGMGTPLLVYGATAGQLMVKAGAWMEVVKRLFGIMLLGVAIWLMARILPAQVVMLLWAALAFATAWAFGLFQRGGALFFRAAGVLAALYGIALAASGLTGGYDPIALTRGTPLGETEKHLEFRIIKTVDDLNAEVRKASKLGKTAMLDFYADWCVECLKMDKVTFSDNNVQASLENTVLLQADVTKNDDEDQALLQHFGIYGPPTIVFFDHTGNERRNFRVVGFMDAENFAQHTQQAVSK